MLDTETEQVRARATESNKVIEMQGRFFARANNGNNGVGLLFYNQFSSSNRPPAHKYQNLHVVKNKAT
jgi:hypothetical protein